MRVLQHACAIAIAIPSRAGIRQTQNMQQQVKTDVFIVRIWKEPREASHQPALWRGTVEHVASKAMRHIDHFGDLLDFIEATAGLAEDSSQRT